MKKFLNLHKLTSDKKFTLSASFIIKMENLDSGNGATIRYFDGARADEILVKEKVEEILDQMYPLDQMHPAGGIKLL